MVTLRIPKTIYLRLEALKLRSEAAEIVIAALLDLIKASVVHSLNDH